MSQNHTLRRAGAALAAVAVVAAAAMLTAPAASAHVRVIPESTEGGGFAKLTFRVPNESDTAGTTSLVVTLPENAPLAFVSVQPVSGWTATVTKAKLATPVDVHGTQDRRGGPHHHLEGGTRRPDRARAVPGVRDLRRAAAGVGRDGLRRGPDLLRRRGRQLEPAACRRARRSRRSRRRPSRSPRRRTRRDAEDAAAAAPAAATTASGDGADDESTTALWLAGAALVIGAGGVLVGALGWRRAGQGS